MSKRASPTSSPPPVQGKGEMPGLLILASNPPQESQGRMAKQAAWTLHPVARLAASRRLRRPGPIGYGPHGTSPKLPPSLER